MKKVHDTSMMKFVIVAIAIFAVFIGLLIYTFVWRAHVNEYYHACGRSVTGNVTLYASSSCGDVFLTDKNKAGLGKILTSGGIIFPEWSKEKTGHSFTVYSLNNETNEYREVVVYEYVDGKAGVRVKEPKQEIYMRLNSIRYASLLLLVKPEGASEENLIVDEIPIP